MTNAKSTRADERGVSLVQRAPWAIGLLLLGCNGSDASGAGGNVGGQPAAAAGGGSPLGGTSAVIGTTIASGGLTASGGLPNVGGSPGGGGATASGGAGDIASGGSNVGGTSVMGSSLSAGGTKAAGGSTASGGTQAKGGASTTGGTSATGGTKATGGTAATGGSSAKSTATFRNPLNTSHGSDPFMAYYNGYYYLAATTWGTTLTMKRGTTVQALKNASPITIWSDTTSSRRGNMWAPEFYLLDNGAGAKRWYHYYTAGDGSDLGTQRPYVLESEGTDPMGPYHFKAQLLNYWAIDGSLLQVGSQLYFMFSAWENSYQKIWIIAMSNAWTVIGARTQLSMSTYDWEKEGTATPVTANYVNEGPVALYRGGRTFVTYSASQCGSPGYKLGLLELVASNPLAASSWTKSASAVFQTANNAFGSGHNGFFKSPDGTEDWLVYHATSNAAGSCWTDRTTRIQRLNWNTNGTPAFGVPLALATDITVPSGE